MPAIKAKLINGRSHMCAIFFILLEGGVGHRETRQLGEIFEIYL